MKTKWIFVRVHGEDRWRMFGTNDAMLAKGDLERFRKADVSRYPVGAMEGYDNEVVLFECDLPEKWRYSADRAFEEYRKGRGKVDGDTV